MTDGERKRRSLARWVEPPVDARALERSWLVIRERVRRRRSPWLAWWAAGALVTASLGVLAWAMGFGEPELPPIEAAPGQAPARDRYARALDTGVPPEEALARLVEEYDLAGDQPRCRVAREVYLREHARGAHRSEVEHRCR